MGFENDTGERFAIHVVGTDAVALPWPDVDVDVTGSVSADFVAWGLPGGHLTLVDDDGLLLTVESNALRSTDVADGLGHTDTGFAVGAPQSCGTIASPPVSFALDEARPTLTAGTSAEVDAWGDVYEVHLLASYEATNHSTCRDFEANYKSFVVVRRGE